MKNSRWDELAKRVKAGVATRPELAEFVENARQLRILVIEAINMEVSLGDTWDQWWPQIGYGDDSTQATHDKDGNDIRPENGDPEDPVTWRDAQRAKKGKG